MKRQLSAITYAAHAQAIESGALDERQLRNLVRALNSLASDSQIDSLLALYIQHGPASVSIESVWDLDKGTKFILKKRTA